VYYNISPVDRDVSNLRSTDRKEMTIETIVGRHELRPVQESNAACGIKGRTRQAEDSNECASFEAVTGPWVDEPV
jgi:hypothetical protein